MAIRTIWIKGEVPYTKNFGTLAELLALVPSTEFAEGFASDYGRIDWSKGAGRWMSGGKLLSPDGSTLVVDRPIVAPSFSAASARIGEARTRKSLGRRHQVSFNAFDLLHARLQGYSTGDNSAELAYIKSSGGLYVRVMYPVFSTAQWGAQVFAHGIPDREFLDSDFRTTFLQYSDALFAEFATYGLLMNPCLFWGAAEITAANGETTATGFLAASKTRTMMARFVVWFARRYRRHEALGFISFGNEWYPNELYSGSPIPVADLAATYSELSSALDSVAPEIMRTADTIYPLADSVASRKTVDEMISVYAAMFDSLDAWNLHVYSNGSYVGRSSTYDAATTIAAANNWGYEFLSLSMSAFASAARQRGKLFIVGETGVDTDREAVSDTKKQLRFYRAAAEWADLVMVWNVQPEVRAVLPGSTQPKIFIEPGTTRGNAILGLVQALNQETYPAANGASISAPGIRKMFEPTRWATTSTAVGSNINAPIPVALGGSAFSVMGWLRPNSVLPDFARIFRLRATANDGVVLLASSSDNAIYYTLAGAGGAQVLSLSGLMKITAPGVWTHFGMTVIPGATPIGDAFCDGVFWTARSASGPMGVIPATTPVILGNDAVAGVAGSDVSFQDWAVLPGRITSERLIRHAKGIIEPEALMHLRALEGGPVVDVSPRANAVTIGAGVTYA